VTDQPTAEKLPLRDQTVCCRSANWANSAWHPFGVDKWAVSRN